jgi:hypothetical protein
LGQSEEVNLIDLIKEIQIWDKQGKKMRMAWWIPTEYWKVALAGYKEIPPGTVDQISNLLADYMFIAAADVSVEVNGSMSFSSETDIRKSINLIDSNGKKYQPLPAADIRSEVITMAETMKPMFAQTLGQMGQGIQLYFFKVKDNKNMNLISAKQAGNFKVQHSNCEFSWSLPLSTLLPPKYCPVDKQKMQGNWQYCPIHGQKLN